MDLTEEPQRRSRAKRKATGKNVILSLDDVHKTFLPLYRHGRLPTSYLVAFRGNGGGAKHRLKNLYHETEGEKTHYLERIERRWRYINPLYRDELYELGQRGEDELRAADLIGNHANPLQQKARMRELVNLPHAVMISTTTASIELAIQNDPVFRFYAWDQVIDNMRLAQQEKQLPFAMPVSISHTFRSFDPAMRSMTDRVEHKTFDMVPDGVCVIENCATKEAIGLTLEAENRKQSGASNLDHTSFLKTFLAYRDVNKHLRYEKLGLTSLMVLVVTRSKRKIDEMKKVIMEATDGQGSRQFLFRDIPIFGGPDKAPKPDATLFTGGWDRAGYPPFFLNTFSETPKLAT